MGKQTLSGGGVMKSIKLSDQVNNILNEKYPDRNKTFGDAPRWDEVFLTYFDVIEEKLAKLEQLKDD